MKTNEAGVDGVSVDFRAHLAPSPVDDLIGKAAGGAESPEFSKARPKERNFWFTVRVVDLNSRKGEPVVDRPKRSLELCANWRF